MYSSPRRHLDPTLHLVANMLPRRSADRLVPLSRRPPISAAHVTMLFKSRAAYSSTLLPAIPGERSSGIPVFGPCRDNSGPGFLHPVGLPWDEPGSNSTTTPAAHNLPSPCVLTCRYRGSLLSRAFSLQSTYHGTCAKVWSLGIVWTSLPGCCFLVTDCQDSQTVDPQGFFRVEAARMKLHQTKIGPATWSVAPLLSLGKKVLAITISGWIEIARSKSTRHRCRRVVPDLSSSRV